MAASQQTTQDNLVASQHTTQDNLAASQHASDDNKAGDQQGLPTWIIDGRKNVEQAISAGERWEYFMKKIKNIEIGWRNTKLFMLL